MDVFCKIISGELPAKKLAEGQQWIAIEDIHPQAPVHVLVIPKVHFTGLEQAQDKPEVLAALLLAVGEIAQQTGIADKGYRVIINQGQYGGQLVPHFHIHVLGGKDLGPKIVR